MHSRRVTGTAPGTVDRELTRLAHAGILERERRGNQLAYRADGACPILDELASIVRKTSGRTRATGADVSAPGNGRERLGDGVSAPGFRWRGGVAFGIRPA